MAVSIFKNANGYKINGNSEPSGVYRALYSSNNTFITIVNSEVGNRSIFPRTLITEILKEDGVSTYADFDELDTVLGDFFKPSGSGGTDNVTLDFIPKKGATEFVDSAISEDATTVTSSKPIVAPNITVESASISVGIHKLSSGGENFLFTNKADGDIFYPVWVKNGEQQAYARFTTGTEQSLTQEASKADILINPSWTSNVIIDWRVVKLTVESDTTITNVKFQVTKNGEDFGSAKFGTLTANVEKTVVLDDTTDNVPLDAFQGQTYIVSVSSPDGDVRLKGSIANSLPFFKVGYFNFMDLSVVTEAPIDGNQYARKDSGWNQVVDAGGDMLKATYDPTNVNGDSFLRSNHTGTQTASTISDFDTEVSNNTDVAANTAKVSASGSVTSHSDVTSAGSGDIITIGERSNLNNQSNTNTGDVTLNADDTTQETLNLSSQELQVNVVTTTTDGAMIGEDKLKLDNLIANSAGDSWTSGLLVTENSPKDQQISYGLGTYQINGIVKTITPSGLYDLENAFGSVDHYSGMVDDQHAFVNIYVDNAEVIKSERGIVVEKGEIAHAPLLPDDSVCVAIIEIKVDKNDNPKDIRNKDIEDCRHSSSVNTDRTVSITPDDETTGYLSDKLSDNGNVTFTIENPGAIETLKADVDIAGDSAVAANTAKNTYPSADATKLLGIESLAEVNNISDVNATDLTDGGETILHTHPSSSTPDIVNYTTNSHIDNYDVSTFGYDVIFIVNTGSNREVKSLSGGYNGQKITFVNADNNAIKFKNNNGGGQKLRCEGASDKTGDPYGGGTIVYDAATGYWYLVVHV